MLKVEGVMKSLPKDVSKYANSQTFSESSIPESLRKSHRTKADNWAKIVVLEGRLLYRILTPEIEEIELSPDLFGIVEPEVPHVVEALGGVRFYLEFYH